MRNMSIIGTKCQRLVLENAVGEMGWMLGIEKCAKNIQKPMLFVETSLRLRGKGGQSPGESTHFGAEKISSASDVGGFRSSFKKASNL